MEARVGISGWSFAEWKDTLYRDVPQRRWLAHYASVFDTVEINYTFRRTMAASTAMKWNAEVPEGFRFSMKAHQRITHQHRLGDPVGQLPFFIDSARALGVNLGPVLFQLPPNFVRNDDRLIPFLTTLPKDLDCAFEFRHQSWFAPEVYSALTDAGAALVIAESADPKAVEEITAPFTYLRLRSEEYTDAHLKSWAARIGDYPVDRAWVYLKHEAKAPEYASRLADLLV